MSENGFDKVVSELHQKIHVFLLAGDHDSFNVSSEEWREGERERGGGKCALGNILALLRLHGCKT